MATNTNQSSGNEADWIIRTNGLTKSYRGAKRNAVDGLDITIERETIHGILGPNGAGKTTTLSLLCGLLKPDKGKIDFGPGLETSRRREVIGYVPQELALYSKLTGKGNLKFFGHLYGVRGAALEKKVMGLLDMVGLTDRAGDLAQTYSTGMLRRLNLAAGLVSDPKIILLDEPTVGIDPQSRNRIFETIFGLRQQGVTVLYTTHYMEEATKLCNTIAIMDHGKIVLDGNPRTLVEQFGYCDIEYQLDGNPTVFVQELEKIELIAKTQVEKKSLHVSVKGESDKLQALDIISNTAKSCKLNLVLKNVMEPNLESLFLDITGRKLRDGGEEN
jgi:linearmycin/streptolysin S transport system ATP-binding protein